MATQLQSPGTMSDDSSTGSVSWSSPDNAKVSDNVYATADLGGGSTVVSDAKLVKGGTIQSTDKASGGFTSTEAYASFGGLSDLWSNTWTSSDINASNFGFVLNAYGYAVGTYSHYIKATNFGFSIPTGATINGILVEVEKSLAGDNKTAQIDHIRITVYYTEAALPGRTITGLSTATGLSTLTF